MIRKKAEKKEEKTKKSIKASKKKTNKENVNKKRVTQNAIYYDKMLRSGIAMLGNDLYSQTEKFEDINYSIAPEEEQQSIFGRYMGLLNALGNEVDMQLTICNHPIDEEELLSSIIRHNVGDGYDELREELNQSIISSLEKGTNKIISEKYITYTVKEDNFYDAKKSLTILHNEMENKFMDLGSHCEVLDGRERLKLIRTIMNPAKPFEIDYDALLPGYTTKDCIAPDLLDFKTSEDYFKIDDRYAKVMYLKTWATEMNDSMINSLSRIEHNITTSFHMRVYERGKDINEIKKRIALMENEITNRQEKSFMRGHDPQMLPMNLRYAYEEGTALLDDVEKRNERLFETELLIMINTETLDELREAEKAVNVAMRNLSCEMGTLFMRQEEGFNSILPLGLPIEGKGRTLTTKVCAIVLPFTSVELMQKDEPLYYGVNQTTGNLILCNRSKLQNPAAWILAKPGAGKSFKVKHELSQVLCFQPESDIIVIDPQGEYAFLAEDSFYHGTVIKIDNRSGTYFNPFEGDYDNTFGFVKIKVDFAQTIMTEIMGEKALTPTEKSIVDKGITRMYQEYEGRRFADKNAEMPTLKDFRNILMQENNPEAQAMADALYTYTDGSYDIFANKTNVKTDNRLTVYDVSEIGDSMRSLGYKIILETLRDKILHNKKIGRRTYIYIDEIYLLLKDDYSENFFYEFYKWSRKFDGYPTGITQNVEELLLRTKTRTTIGNAESIIMLNQSKSDLIQLGSLLGLSNEQMKTCLNAPRGYGLFRYGKAIVPFKDEYPKNTHTYDLWNTDPDEIKKIRQEKQQKEGKKYV